MQENAVCTNRDTPGTNAYDCTCDAGYALVETSTEAVCTNINECAAGTYTCQVPSHPKQDV